MIHIPWFYILFSDAILHYFIYIYIYIYIYITDLLLDNSESTIFLIKEKPLWILVTKKQIISKWKSKSFCLLQPYHSIFRSLLFVTTHGVLQIQHKRYIFLTFKDNQISNAIGVFLMIGLVSPWKSPHVCLNDCRALTISLAFSFSFSSNNFSSFSNLISRIII